MARMPNNPTARRRGRRTETAAQARVGRISGSRVRTGPPAPEPRPFRLAELAAKVRTALETRSGRVSWRLAVPDDLVVEADPDQLFRVLFNLAQNGLEAMEGRAGLLRISAELAPQQLAIEVADSGPGIPALQRGRLFEPFAGSSKPDGNGLGLAICRGIVEAHGGTIRAASPAAQGRGTRIVLRLPVEAQPAPAPEQAGRG